MYVQIHRLKNFVPRMHHTHDTAVPQRRIQELEEELGSYLSVLQLHFVISQIRVGMLGPKVRRWTVTDKTRALSLLHSSPKTYRLLRLIFTLPSVCTLRNIIRQMEVYPGFNKYILHALKLKIVSMPAASKLEALLLDEM